MVELPTWQPTMAHLRAAVIGVVGTAIGVMAGRLDVLVIAVPFVIVAAWGVLTRPVERPRADAALAHRRVREGDVTTWTVTAEGSAGCEHVVVVLAADQWRQLHPGAGAHADAMSARQPISIEIAVRSTRWGTTTVGPGLVAAHGAWGAFRSGPLFLTSSDLTTLPMPAVFGSSAPAPHPSGLVGINRSRVPGDGSEFATIRPFQLGDRLRRIHWPVSLRTGEMHVSGTYTDRDSEVMLVLDVGNDVGVSEGIDGRASSLDLGVRAAGALAEHFLGRGDRVGLRSFATEIPTRVPALTGAAHLRRLLSSLALVTVGSGRYRSGTPRPLGVAPGSFVVMLSPLLSAVALEQAATLVRHQITVVVVDILPESITHDHGDPFAALAWRIRLLERRREIRSVQERGVPVVAWRGPGSLDQVLRDLGRRAGAPRVVRR